MDSNSQNRGCIPIQAIALSSIKHYIFAKIPMPPKITDTVAWQQAELLMQPAFIRIVDQIRKQLEVSDWKGTYQDVLIWPPGTTDETKATVIQLLQELEGASPEKTGELKRAIAQLPIPQPGYHLCLQQPDMPQINVDLWELCYQVCFRDYNPALSTSANQAVEIDTSLIEDETGDVDWQRLDTKAGNVVEQVFANLPNG